MTISIISHPECLLHDMGKQHPECPDRLRVIDQELKKISVEYALKEYSAPLATLEQLHRVHDAAYVDYIFKNAPRSGFFPLDPDTCMNPNTLQAALRAAGAGILGVDLVLSQEANSVFCNIRPPGHHAEKSKAMGFCFFNNVAVATAHALEFHQLKRVAIIDFDVHHGNGTENIFQNEERVLFCSSFEFPFYPFSGADTKRNHIINVPLPAETTGQLFREQIEKNWFNRLIHFRPEMIFFSAGFDGFIHDMMSDLLLTEEDYAWLTKKIKQIADETCNGRIVSLLEGGYDLNGLGGCVAAHIRGLSNNTS